MNTLGLENVDLVSIQRAAPKNGAPSSGDYNDTMREMVSDLVSITELINQRIVPVLNALPDTAADGLAGSSVFADPGAVTPLFYDSAENRPLTISEVLQNLFNSNGQLAARVSDLAGKVAKLQTLLSTTGQNDVLASVQSFSDQIKNLTTLINTIRTTTGAYEERFQRIRSVRFPVDDVQPHSYFTGDVAWDIPFSTGDYTVTVSVEDETGSLLVSGWKKLDGGRGINLKVFNSGEEPVSGIVHMIGQLNAEAA